MKALIANAAGTKISLLRNEPLATAHTTGNSRSARTPETCCALSARSSPSTPAVFLAGSSLLMLLDDIAAVLDDVALMTKMAAMKRY